MKGILALWILAAWPALAVAQQPFYTDDADVAPTGTVHVEAFNEFDRLQRDQVPHLRQNTMSMRVNYGLGKGLELDLDSPLIAIFNDPSTQPRRPFGLGDTNFGVKYRLRDEREGSRAPALTVTTYIEVPTGDSTTALGSGLTDTWMYLVAQKTIAPAVVLRLNGGYLFTGNTVTGVIGITAHGHVATASGSIVWNVSDTWKIGAELAGAATNNASVNRSQLQALVGGNYQVRDGLSLDFGVLGGRFAASPRIGFQFGFSLDLPHKSETRNGRSSSLPESIARPRTTAGSEPGHTSAVTKSVSGSASQ